MFGALTEKFQQLFSSISGQKKLTEENVSEAVRKVRLALLDADVSYAVVSALVKRIKEKALGERVQKSLTPGDQFIQVVHEELIQLMGGGEASLQFDGSPSVFVLCGLQGSGKTTQTAKLAHFLQKEKKRVLVAACDLARPAAVEQLTLLCGQIQVPVFSLEGEKDPIRVAKEAKQRAVREGYDVLLVDTAGRLHVDEILMQELKGVVDALKPSEVLFVASAQIGNDAVKVATAFDQGIGITGSILTMLDGSARAGAAISIREVTGKPLKFEGIGEKVGDLQLFNPESMASRILGMGDVINLTKRVKEHFDAEEEIKLEAKIRQASFTYEDYLKQMAAVKKMGSMKSLLRMLPGMSQIEEIEGSDEEFGAMEAMILSMTDEERQERVELIPSRRRRIARGSGCHFDDVNRMVKGFKRAKQFFKGMNKGMNLWQ